MAFSAQDEYEMLVGDFCKGFDSHINERNFKQGVFKGLIDKTTAPLFTLSILIASPHITSAEKTKFRKAYSMYTTFENSDLRHMTRLQFFMLCDLGHDFADIFNNDAIGQGIVVAPITASCINPLTGEVMTLTAGEEGTITNIREGGEPDAMMKIPDVFNAAFINRQQQQQEQRAMLRL